MREHICGDDEKEPALLYWLTKKKTYTEWNDISIDKYVVVEMYKYLVKGYMTINCSINLLISSTVGDYFMKITI